MKVEGLPELIKTAVTLEMYIAKAEKEEDYEAYCQLADIYRQLAEKCKEMTLEWRY